MSRKIIMASFAAIFMLMACGPSGDNKPERRKLIPEDKLVAILTDSYLTTGMMDVQAMRETWGQRDSILNYIDVIRSHGYTYEQLEETMQYYFTHKPKKLAKIYDRVTGNLLALEVKVENERIDADSIPDNLWTGKAEYIFPGELPRDSIWFDIPAEAPGEYVIKADITLYEDDGSLDPRVTVYFFTSDSLGVEVRNDWEEIRLEKNGQLHKIEARKTIENVGNSRIRGWLLNHSPQKGTWQKHATVGNISIKLDKEKEKVKQR
jgi:hypothetical protein